MPIILDGDRSTADLNNIEHERQPHWGFGERIPLSLSLPDESGHVEGDSGSKLGSLGSTVLISLSKLEEVDYIMGDEERRHDDKDGGRRKEWLS